MRFWSSKRALLVGGHGTSNVYTLNPSQQRLYSTVITFLFFLLLLLVLKISQVPEPKYKADRYKEIDWAKFTPPPIQPTEIETPAEPTKEIAELPETASSVKTITRVDLSSILEDINIGTLESVVRASVGPELGTSVGTESQVKISLSESQSILGDLKLLFDDSKTSLSLPSTAEAGGHEDQSSFITLKKGSAIVDDSPDYGGGGIGLGGPEGKEIGYGDGTVVQVGLKTLDEIGSGFDDFSPLFRPLLDWMKKHPGEFPEIVKRFMEYSVGDLTSVVNFVINDRRFLMFLLCKEQIYEIRISLIEENSLTYLIDRGFKEQSNYLRFGSVERQANGTILSFGTTRQAAADKRTTEFYQIFLSWWDTVKAEVEEG